MRVPCCISLYQKHNWGMRIKIISLSAMVHVTTHQKIQNSNKAILGKQYNLIVCRQVTCVDVKNHSTSVHTFAVHIHVVLSIIALHLTETSIAKSAGQSCNKVIVDLKTWRFKDLICVKKSWFEQLLSDLDLNSASVDLIWIWFAKTIDLNPNLCWRFYQSG